jgi:hydroxymethylglutaryl-CoA synthase
VDATGAAFAEFEHFCYHLPFSRMGLKAHLHLARMEKAGWSSARLQRQIEPSLAYNRLTGNAYTASLYLGLLSLLDQTSADLSGSRIGFFSYGSGCMGAFFGGTVIPGYQNHLGAESRRRMLEGREMLSYDVYESFYTHALPENGRAYRTPRHRTGDFRLAGVRDHQRMYEPVPGHVLSAEHGPKACAAAPMMG